MEKNEVENKLGAIEENLKSIDSLRKKLKDAKKSIIEQSQKGKNPNLDISINNAYEHTTRAVTFLVTTISLGK